MYGWAVRDSNPRSLRQLIYSQPHLATLVTAHKHAHPIHLYLLIDRRGYYSRRRGCCQAFCDKLHEKRKAECSMTVEQLSFQIIPCPMGISSSHTHLVVSGRGVPHEPLTLF